MVRISLSIILSSKFIGWIYAGCAGGVAASDLVTDVLFKSVALPLRKGLRFAGQKEFHGFPPLGFRFRYSGRDELHVGPSLGLRLQFHCKNEFFSERGAKLMCR